MSRYTLKKSDDGKRLAPTGSFTDNDYYKCKYSWLDEDFVQCGDRGILLNSPNRPSFFEAFCLESFIRGQLPRP